jgi:hypothetical protein
MAVLSQATTLPARKLILPLGLNPVDICKISGELATSGCKGGIPVSKRAGARNIYVEYGTPAQIPKPSVKYMG